MTASTAPLLEQLSRAELVPLAYEYMMTGHLIDRALMPQVFLHGQSFDDVDNIAIDEWMGASPNYTERLRTLLGIEGDDVSAMIKALQLDVGFVHQYMDVAYRVHDESHAEFWLNHCGALLDVEPHGEARVVGMCHHIEDPTFDATAFATNPRAQIRPIHRPPRAPEDRHPHCHWTIEIDPRRAPVEVAKHTELVAGFALCDVAIMCATARLDDGLVDYSGDLLTAFRLTDLSTDLLAAVMREFQMQVHLLTASAEAAVADRYGLEVGRRIGRDQWIATSWVATERIANALDISGGGLDAIAGILAIHPGFPPGFEREISADDSTLRMTLTPEFESLLNREQFGWIGQLAREEVDGIAAMLHPVEPKARVVSVINSGTSIEITVGIDHTGEAVLEPQCVALAKISGTARWQFDLSETLDSTD